VNTILRRFLLWSPKGILQRLFKKLISEPEFKWIFIDGSIVKIHQHSAGTSSIEDEAIGKSKGSNTSKIHLTANSYQLPDYWQTTA